MHATCNLISLFNLFLHAWKYTKLRWVFFYRCDALIFLDESPSGKDVAPKIEFYKAIQCG